MTQKQFMCRTLLVDDTPGISSVRSSALLGQIDRLGVGFVALRGNRAFAVLYSIVVYGDFLFHCAVQPPSMGIAEPVMEYAASPAKKTVNAQISSGSTNFLFG